MPTEILMPALSPTMEEGKLAKWLVKEGQAVKAGDIIAEIETDKATMEVEAVDEGKVGRLLVSEGTEGVKVNTPIATLLADGESAGAAPAAKAASRQRRHVRRRRLQLMATTAGVPPTPNPSPHHAEGVLRHDGEGDRSRKLPGRHLKQRRPGMGTAASSPRRWRGGWRSRRGSIWRRSPVPVRMAASSSATWRRRCRTAARARSRGPERRLQPSPVRAC